jgi:hypothetical protein
VTNKDDTSQDLKAAHKSNDKAKKEDERKPAAVNKKVDDATLKMKEPPKRVDEEDKIDNKKPAEKENVRDKKKRRNPKLPLHLNSTGLLPKSIGKSPNMDLDLVDTESESDDNIGEDKQKPWELITTLKGRVMLNLKQATKDKQRRGLRARGIPDEGTKFPVHYTQKNHDTCLFKSVASALHHLNKKQIASVVSSMATKCMYRPADKQLNKLGSIAQKKDCDLLVLTKWMTRKRVGKFDLKTETLGSRGDFHLVVMAVLVMPLPLLEILYSTVLKVML